MPDTDTAPRSTVVTEFSPLVRRISRAMLRDPHDADDAAQETFCLILAHHRDFEERGSLEGWVRRIATRACLRLLRRRRLGSWLMADVPAPAEPAADPDRVRRLYDALDRLSGRERAAFVLHYQEGLPFADVAAAMGCREGTARNYAFRASDKLRRQLGDLA